MNVDTMYPDFSDSANFLSDLAVAIWHNDLYRDWRIQNHMLFLHFLVLFILLSA